MNILSIETSCDETAVALLSCQGDLKNNTFSFKVLGNALHSQIASHEQFGGVVPMLAKREHAKKLIPLFIEVVKNAFPDTHPTPATSTFDKESLKEIFGREEEFYRDFIGMIEDPLRSPLRYGDLSINSIAVTEGPGLEPALWMGIIFAKALSTVLNIPLIPVNHMEGHILSVLPQKIEFPALALLISGGHTELVHMPDWNEYEVIGQTRDDAVGEAFDKVARMLSLPYPGGPEISKLAELQRERKTTTPEYILPRPMINSKDFDFSFSGIKTAVLYSLKGAPVEKEVVAKEFEDAVTEVLVEKTFRAIDEYSIKTLIIGGGVVSNAYIRRQFEERATSYPDLKLLLPDPALRTDNALMIGLAGYVKFLSGNTSQRDIYAKGNLSYKRGEMQ